MSCTASIVFGVPLPKPLWTKEEYPDDWVLKRFPTLWLDVQEEGDHGWKGQSWFITARKSSALAPGAWPGHPTRLAQLPEPIPADVAALQHVCAELGLDASQIGWWLFTSRDD